MADLQLNFNYSDEVNRVADQDFNQLWLGIIEILIIVTIFIGAAGA